MDLMHQVTLPLLLGLAGVICLLIGILGQLSTKWFQFGPLDKSTRWIACVAGFGVMSAAVYIFQHQPSQPAAPTASTNPSPQDGAMRTAPVPPSVNPQDLIQIIKDKQRENIGDSTGTLDYQGFTDAKLAEFKKAKIPAQVSADLKSDASFILLVLKIKEMEPAVRQQLLVRAAKTYRQPWAQLTLNPDTAPKSDLLRGQTSAGSEAEREIATSITALVRELSQQPESELKKLLP